MSIETLNTTDIKSRVCTSCNIEKSLDQYWKNHGQPRWACIPCTQVKKREYRARNKERLNEYSRQYNRDNWHWLSEHQKEYWKQNPDKRREKELKKYTHDKFRCPKWLDAEHRNQIREFIKNAPEKHEIDHIIPIKGKNVSGLHVIWNLQYLTKSENASKSNSFDGTYENNSWRQSCQLQ